jgi:hypothetical protein
VDLPHPYRPVDPCPRCGYDQRGLPGDICPECGLDQVRAAWGDMPIAKPWERLAFIGFYLIFMGLFAAMAVPLVLVFDGWVRWLTLVLLAGFGIATIWGGRRLWHLLGVAERLNRREILLARRRFQRSKQHPTDDRP